MARYAEGDDTAFHTVFAVVGPRLLGFLFRMSSNRELAQDLLQESLLRMHQARSAFRPGSPVLPWAYAIARNTYLDAARARRRMPASSHPESHAATESVVDADAESELFARETAAAVQRALLVMTPARREAFVLLRYEGLSVREAAEVLGASETAIKLRAFQAYQAIREAMARLEQDPKRPRRG